MRTRLLELIGVAVVIMAVVVFLKLTSIAVLGQTPTAAKTAAAMKAGPAAKTAWGEPDLQGIWSDDYQIPLERPARYAGKEVFTDAEIAELDKQRAPVWGGTFVRRVGAKGMSTARTTASSPRRDTRAGVRR